MRPRVFPAEDDEYGGSVTGPHVASMRPRVFPAEDQGCRRVRNRASLASMRPRVFPAEDLNGVREFGPLCSLLQ